MSKCDRHELKKVDGIFGKYKHLKSLQVRYTYTFQHFYQQLIQKCLAGLSMNHFITFGPALCFLDEIHNRAVGPK